MQKTAICALCLVTWVPAYAASPPAIDGSLNEPYWSVDAREWTAVDARLPQNRVRFLLGYDDRHLYIAADVTDGNVVGSASQGDEIPGQADSVSVAIDFSEDTAQRSDDQVYTFRFSPSGWMATLHGGRHESLSPASEYRITLKPGTSLNDPSPDTGYIAEARIALADLARKRPLSPESSIGLYLANFCQPEGNGKTLLTPTPEASRPDPQSWERIRLNWQAAFTIRGWAVDLPLPAGPEPDWRKYETNQDDMQGPWLNRPRWIGLFDSMKSWRLSSLLLEHPDPLPRLTSGPGSSEASLLARDQGQLNWLMAEAHARGIKVYLTVRGSNAEMPTTRPAATRPAGELRVDRVLDLLRSQPGLGGIVLNVDGPAPAGIDWAIQVARSMGHRAAELGAPTRPPELLLNADQLTPAAARQVVGSYSHTRLLCSFQPGAWTSPKLDPRAGQLAIHAATGKDAHPGMPISCVAIGGPGAAHDYLFWGDPEWMRDVSLDLRRAGFDGMFLRARGVESWLAAEAWGAYSMAPADLYNSLRWQNRVRAVYGVGPYAGQLLEAMQNASAIMPSFASLIYDPSEHYMPQFGMPLLAYASWPTAAEFQERNSSPHRPPWTSQPPLAASLPAAPTQAARPMEIADQIAARVNRCQLLLTGLRDISPDSPADAPRLTDLLEHLELMTALGEHLEQRIRACVAWQNAVDGAEAADALSLHLRNALTAWTRAAAMGDRLSPQPVSFWDTQVVSPPPWTPELIERSREWTTTRWADRSREWEREVAAILNPKKKPGTGRVALPPWDSLHTLIDPQMVASLSFDARDLYRCRLGSGATISGRPEVAIKAYTLVADTRGLGSGWHQVFTTDPTFILIPGGHPLQIAFKYRVLEVPASDPEPFMVSLRPSPEGPAIGTHTRWGAPAGYFGVRTIQTPPPDYDGYVLSLDVLGEGVLAIDDVVVSVDHAPPG